MIFIKANSYIYQNLHTPSRTRVIKTLAIIGSGISGLTCAYYLGQRYRVSLFEKNAYLGGHTCTVDVKAADGDYAIDTGFIVCNDRNYPEFMKLMKQFGCELLRTEMSFSVKSERFKLEYKGKNLATMFAQKRQLFNPAFYGFIGDILRFNRDAKSLIKNPVNLTLKDFLANNRYAKLLREGYLIPMCQAIWSSDREEILNADMQFLSRFFAHHGLLDLTNRPRWYTLKNGARSYIPHFIQHCYGGIYLNTAVKAVRRTENGVVLQTSAGEQIFDAVIFASHSDQSLQMLSDATTAEREILGAIRYQPNEVVLHHDARVMPSQKAAWASWNYADEFMQPHATLTYHMNRLQSLASEKNYFVTMNQSSKIAPDKIHFKTCYEHPVLNQSASQAQRNYSEINGKNRSFFCGAYWGNGFHEDGVVSALKVIEAIEATHV